MEQCIVAKDITKVYGGRKVVDSLSFEVHKGEVFGLLGHNGAGKSTTIDCLLGLTKMEEGSCSLLGMDPRKERKVLFERVGVQLQNSHYPNNIKVKEVCEEMASLYKNAMKYETLLEKFHLASFENQKVDALSGGERQRLAVVVALLSNPEMIFLDELTTGLDVAVRREVWQVLHDLKEKGMTIFLTSHYMEEVENLCDRVLILRDGKKVVGGSVQEIVEHSPYENLEDAYLWYTKKEENK
ncbi:ABC transporter ATP-binding protein [Amedibacillus sp. YH-ame6]